jgi:hypothetical protein
MGAENELGRKARLGMVMVSDKINFKDFLAIRKIRVEIPDTADAAVCK